MTNRGPNDRRRKGKPATKEADQPIQEKKASFADVPLEDVTLFAPIVPTPIVPPPLPAPVVGASKK